MAEETKDASVSVPRAMYAATITHYVFTYLLMMLYICYITPKAGALSTMASSCLSWPSRGGSMVSRRVDE
jgi:amino acid transporter